MSTMHADRIVDDYLRRLEAAAAHLQRSRRAELVSEIREHIEAALRQEDAASEVAVRNVLERLGPPEEIVDAAEPPPADVARRAGKLEIGALIALIVPLLGWLVGAVLVVASRAWSGREKALGLALLLVPVILSLLSVVAEGGGSSAEPAPGTGTPVVGNDPGPAHSERRTDGGWGMVEVVALSLFFLGGLPSAFYLAWRLRRPHTSGDLGAQAAEGGR